MSRCHFCNKRCTADDYCNGCKVHVCAACDHTDPDKRPQGEPHMPEAHRRATLGFTEEIV